MIVKTECAYDEMAPVESLIPNPRNPNKHPEKQLKLLSKIIAAQGWRNPIVVSNRSGFIIKGHARLEAAKILECEAVPVDYQDYESEAEEWADMIADNRLAELAEPDLPGLKDLLQELDTGDFDMDLTGFDTESLEDLMTQFHVPEEGLTDDDAVPENVETICKKGDLWKLGEHRLLCGDATVITDVERLMDGEKADMVFTDPPYGVSIGSKNQALNSIQPSGRCTENIVNDILSPDELYKVLQAAFSNAYIALNDCGAVYVCSPQGGGLGMMMMMMRDSGLEVRHVLNWVKNSPTFSIGRLDYDYQHEPILFTWKKTHKKIMAGEHKTSCWFIDKPRESKLHPTMKPVAIMENAILNSSELNDIVLDLFGGQALP